MNWKYESLVWAMDGAKDTGYPGYYLHGDVNIKGGFPTHTHGLGFFDLPEIFINAESFGQKENANVINMVVWYLSQDEGLFSKVAAGEYIELMPWEEPMTLCLRKVDASFRGTRMAYSGNALETIAKFAQLYVKGDDHVLVDDHYNEEGSPCPGCEK